MPWYERAVRWAIIAVVLALLIGFVGLFVWGLVWVAAVKALPWHERVILDVMFVALLAFAVWWLLFVILTSGDR